MKTKRFRIQDLTCRPPPLFPADFSDFDPLLSPGDTSPVFDRYSGWHALAASSTLRAAR
jgi:hypothetical protein